jgi:hypothetical protein
MAHKSQPIKITKSGGNMHGWKTCWCVFEKNLIHLLTWDKHIGLKGKEYIITHT